MQGKSDNLEAFAKRIATRVKKGSEGTDSMELLICRLLTGEDVKVSAALAAKWAEWRYGKAKESIELSGTVNLASVIEKARKRVSG
jgi:hypothetical protein